MTERTGRRIVAAMMAAALSVAGSAQVLVGPPAAVPPPKPVDARLAGDDKLSCKAILTEAKARNTEFNTLLAQAEATKIPMSARTMALLAAHEVIATALPLSTPDVSTAGMAAVAGASTAYMESARADERKIMAPLEKKIEFAMARGDYLNELHLDKCMGKTAAPLRQDAPRECSTMKAEADKLRAGMQGGDAAMMAIMAQAGGTPSQAQIDALMAQANSAAQQQAAQGERLSEIETAYAEKCGG